MTTPLGRLACDCPVLPLPRLVHQMVRISRVEIGARTEIRNGILSLDISSVQEEPTAPVVRAQVDIIAPGQTKIPTDTVMDVMPLACKIDGRVGTGTTRVIQGAVLLLTGREPDGRQLGEAGDSSGILSEQVAFGAAGAPAPDDWIIRLAVTLEAGCGLERRGPLAAHRFADRFVQSIREALKQSPDSEIDEVRTMEEPRRTGMPRVVLVKEVMGQGAMHDKLLLPREPAGVAGAFSIIDAGNLPFALRCSEFRDGALHSLCCVGPSTKETTMHYFRDPLLQELADDPQIDLAGVLIVGSPAIESEKHRVAQRLGVVVHSMNVDGAIVATEGYGNNHIDFADHLAEITKYGVPSVGVTWSAHQGSLVVGNEYMVALVEVNKSASGRETKVLSENTASAADAKRAVAMLKTLMAGVDVLPAPTQWTQEVVSENQRLVEEQASRDGGSLAATPGLRSEVPVPGMVPSMLAPLQVPLSQARIALVTAGGAMVRGQPAFDRAGDSTFRAIPAGSRPNELEFGVTSYDHSDVNRDPNCMFPLERLRELATAGEIGALADFHFGIQGGGGDMEVIRTQLAPALIERLKSQATDAVLLTGG